MSGKPKTCSWPSSDPLMTRYHDREWGVPLHNDRKLFEFLVLDAFQAGLSWSIVIKKRAGFRKAFDNFDYNKIAKYDSRKIDKLLSDAGIIRNRMKINSAVDNARAFLAVRKEFGSFDRYVWRFTGNKTIKNRFRKLSELPAKSKESDAMSIDLRKRGFKFVGSTICYAFMQASGMVNDHMTYCFRYGEV